MAKITIAVDADLSDVFAEIEDKTLIMEMEERGLRCGNDEYELDKAATLDLLREAADLFRAANKLNRGLAIDNLIEELYL